MKRVRRKRSATTGELCRVGFWCLGYVCEKRSDDWGDSIHSDRGSLDDQISAKRGPKVERGLSL